MSMSWHHNDLPVLVGISLPPPSHTKFSLLFVIMEPMIFTHSFTIDAYDVTVAIEFFAYIVVLEDSSLELTDDESENVDIFLNL